MEVFLNFYNDLKSLGQVFKTGSQLVFFSNDRFDLDFLKEKKIAFSILHQVHGNQIVKAPVFLPQADGQWTDKKKLALIIKTADCLPVFIIENEKIMALHMGWRGFKEKIFETAMTHINNPVQCEIYIGPHIGFNSFQVDVITAANILQSQDLTWKITEKEGLTKKSIYKKDHYFVDLQGLLIRKAKNLGFKKIIPTSTDTCTSPTHYSHRRNRNRTGTNYSFALNI